jgi:hypothetical protein
MAEAGNQYVQLEEVLEQSKRSGVIVMNRNMKTKLIEIPIAGNPGVFWNRLHSEREDICEVMIKDSQSSSPFRGETEESLNPTTARCHRELLQERLRRIDAALDRLMSGSYGHCSKCGRSIEDAKLERGLRDSTLRRGELWWKVEHVCQNRVQLY